MKAVWDRTFVVRVLTLSQFLPLYAVTQSAEKNFEERFCPSGKSVIVSHPLSSPSKSP